MTYEEVLREFIALPPEGQRLVTELIAFLRQRYEQPKSPKTTPEPDLSSEGFIGMWKDRDEMSDSTAWVRQLRQKEWSN